MKTNTAGITAAIIIEKGRLLGSINQESLGLEFSKPDGTFSFSVYALFSRR